MARGKERGEQIWGLASPTEGEEQYMQKSPRVQSRASKGGASARTMHENAKEFAVCPDRYGYMQVICAIWQQRLVARASATSDPC